MSNYYIKYVWGPHAQKGYPYPGGNLIHFAAGQEQACQRFKECKGFLLYETGSKEGNKTGAKAIYAQGIVASDQPKSIKSECSRNKEFSYAVRVNLQKRVDPEDGIPFKEMKEITGVKNMQRRGGLLEITKGHYKKLYNYLINQRDLKKVRK